tara:strand:+ start:818 stop:1072 length:255 start_codon:yes stop_codon:yes gene_type:complete
MKATLTREEYKQFTINVDKLKQYENISVPHAVEFKGDNVEISLLKKIDTYHLDNMLEKINLGVDNSSSKSYNESNKNQTPIRRK